MLGLKIFSYADRAGYDSATIEDSFFFTSEAASMSNEKTPISSVLPGTEPILIDLGQWKVNIKLDGVAHKDYFDMRYQGTELVENRICRRNDLEIFGSNIDYNISTTGVYTYQGGTGFSTVNLRNWYNKFLVLEDKSSLGNDNSGITYIYAVKVSNVSIRTNNNTDFIEYSTQLVGYRLV